MFKKKLLVALLVVFSVVAIGAKTSFAEEVMSDDTFMVDPESLDGNQVSSRGSFEIAGYSHIQKLGNQNLRRVDSKTFRLGTTGKALRLEGFAIASSAGTFRYESHIQSLGWQAAKANGVFSGTAERGLRVEAVKMSFAHPSLGIKYRVHIQGLGWTGWKNNYSMAGTTGQARRLEAIEFQFYNK